MKTRLILLAVTTLAIAAPVMAEQADVNKQFRALDADKNGFISVIEATGQNELLMKWADTDKNTDGQLEISEFSAFEPSKDYVPPENTDRPDIGAAPFK